MRIRRMLPLVLVAMVLPLGVPSAAEARQCGVIRADGLKYEVAGHDNLRCRFMRKWSRRVARGEGHPRGWRCSRAWRSGGCQRGVGFDLKWFAYKPPA
jgi:hypothetical protein